MSRIRRSLLFVPADDARKLRKAVSLPTDSVILELEDGVALNMKGQARANAAEALRAVDFGYRERLVRVNAASTEFFDEDVRATIDARPAGYVLPKAETADEVRKVCALLDDAEAQHGWPAGALRLLVLIETPLAVLNLKEIAAVSGRLDALVFGAEDLAGAIGAQRTKSAVEVLCARSAVVIAAAAYDLQPIDMVCNEVDDLSGLAEECAFGRQLGYTGKMCIHPRQLEIVNRAFTPTDAEIGYARRVVAAHDSQQAGGKGAFSLDGRMVDMPIVKQAMRILALADGGHGAPPADPQ